MSKETNERSGARERSEECGSSEKVSDAIEQTNGQASGPVLISLPFLNHSAKVSRGKREGGEEKDVYGSRS